MDQDFKITFQAKPLESEPSPAPPRAVNVLILAGRGSTGSGEVCPHPRRHWQACHPETLGLLGREGGQHREWAMRGRPTQQRGVTPDSRFAKILPPRSPQQHPLHFPGWHWDGNIAFRPLGPQKGEHSSRACVHPVLLPTGPRPRSSTPSAQKEDLAR